MASFNAFSLQAVRDGLSVAQTPDPTDGRVGSSTPASISSGDRTLSDPTAAMARQSASRELSRLTYPADTPPYFLQISVQEYSRKSWRQIADVNPLASVVLPVPGNLIDGQTVDWEGDELGLAGSIAMNGLSGAGESLGGVKGALGSVERLAGRVAGGVGSALFPGAVGGVLSAQGIAINNYLTMMLKGPTYKRHDFTWVLSPRTPDESTALARIRRLLLDAQAPDLEAMGAFFKYPCVFNLSFNHSSADMTQNLYGFKPCVLTSAVFNHAPNSVPAFFSRTKMPESIAIRLEFTELEFWLRGDYGSEAFGPSTGGGGGW